MFSLLATAAPAAGSWAADHSQMLRDFSCTSERERMHWCTSKKGGDGNAGVNMATVSTSPATAAGGAPLGAAAGNPYGQVSYETKQM